jgi:glucose-6-phosphate dehydrogenase assembly protein OpcA
MATIYKTLGQIAPAATTLTTLYTVPASTAAVVSSIVVANQSSAVATYRIAVRLGGTSIDPKQYLVYDAVLSGNTSIAYTLGITLATTDVISVYSSSTTLSFQAFGSEIS